MSSGAFLYLLYLVVFSSKVTDGIYLHFLTQASLTAVKKLQLTFQNLETFFVLQRYGHPQS